MPDHCIFSANVAVHRALDWRTNNDRSAEVRSSVGTTFSSGLFDARLKNRRILWASLRRANGAEPVLLAARNACMGRRDVGAYVRTAAGTRTVLPRPRRPAGGTAIGSTAVDISSARQDTRRSCARTRYHRSRVPRLAESVRLKVIDRSGIIPRELG